MRLFLHVLYQVFVHLAALYYLPVVFFKGLFGDKAGWVI